MTIDPTLSMDARGYGEQLVGRPVPTRSVPRYLPPVHFPLPVRQLVAAGLSLPSDYRRRYASTVEWLRARFPGRAIALTDSGTSALAIAIAASRVGSPTKVPVVSLPAYACPDLGTAAVAAGAQIMLYDVDPATLQPDWSSLSRTLSEGATHVIATHLYGRAVDVSYARQLAESAGAVVIEDAAQGADAFWMGAPAGTLAKWSIMSLGRGKGINAGGGGILLGPESAFPSLDATPLPAPSLGRDLLRLTAACVTQWLSAPWLYGIPARLPVLRIGETKYHAPASPQRISRAAMYLVRAAFEQSALAAPNRRRVEEGFLDALQSSSTATMPKPDARAVSGALRVPVLIDPAAAASLRPLGVVRSYPRHLGEYPEIAARCSRPRDMPGAALLAGRTHTLPTHSLLTGEDIHAIVSGIRGTSA